MLGANLAIDFLVKGFRNLHHFLQLSIRESTANIIVADVPLLSKCVEASDESCALAERQRKRLDDPIVMAVSRCTVSGGCKCRRGGLQSSVVE
jgi:hypothetical protein